MPYERPIPPPIWDPLVDPGHEPEWDWYYGPGAGDMILPFKKYEGQRRQMHKVDLPYLLFCQTKTRRASFLAAFGRYHQGLCELVESDGYHYEDFRVPFGAKHRGLRIRECRDKPWLMWCSTRPYLINKHPLFFRAVERWIANPRKTEHTRDVGELLSRSQYKDDLNRHMDEADNPSDSENEAPESDSNTDLDGFIVSDSAPIEVKSPDAEEEEEEEQDVRWERRRKRARNKRRSCLTQLDKNFIDNDSEPIIVDNNEGNSGDERLQNVETFRCSDSSLTTVLTTREGEEKEGTTYQRY
ncbi:hypothetical protein DFH07DRAFT_410238 [Mycena maculata]|uniref:Uncharacterized protein n=1 Tax=Mycena maculata TaxID=230809 RepID=A0AAD7NIQ2_9AGAR|nr:hypothetical protein DFH07DRAFT_410238 [Mycena maculata]